MDLKSVSSTRLYVADLDKSCDFYEKLSFRFGMRDDGRAVYYKNWYSVELIKAPADDHDNRGAGMAMCMKVDGIQEAYDFVRSLGYEPVAGPAKAAGGTTEFEVRDPDGHRLVFFDK